MSDKKKKTKTVMPKWMDCAWRRVPCGRDNCPICRRVKEERDRHLASGEDPDAIETVLEDVGRSLKEALAMIKADAKRRGFKITNLDKISEPPRPGAWPLYIRVKEWRDGIYGLADESDMTSSAWLYTDEAEDLLWYVNTLIAKTYRQLCNRWHLKHGDEYGQEDYAYTRYVLGECFKILKESLAVFTGMEIEQKNKLKLALLILNNLEEEVMAI